MVSTIFDGIAAAGAGSVSMIEGAIVDALLVDWRIMEGKTRRVVYCSLAARLQCPER